MSDEEKIKVCDLWCEISHDDSLERHFDEDFNRNWEEIDAILEFPDSTSKNSTHNGRKS